MCGARRVACRVLVATWKNLHGWGMILKWTFEKWDEEHGLDRSGSGKGHEAGCCENGNEPSGSKKFAKFSAN
jgi:hypothetical protein